MADLPESYRAVFLRSRFGACTNIKIAAELGISVKTVEYRITQSLKLLRIALKEYLESPTSKQKLLDTGAKRLGAEVKSSNAGAKKLDAGAKRLDAGVKSFDVGAKSFDAGVKSSDVGAKSFDAGVKSSDVGVNKLKNVNKRAVFDVSDIENGSLKFSRGGLRGGSGGRVQR
jgi:hypothetical protein